jgi:hypothetical protein
LSKPRKITYSGEWQNPDEEMQTFFIFALMIKYTNQFLTKLEELIAESDYILRYEKGNFKSGYCVLKDQKIMIVNKFFAVEGKINALLDILKGLELDTSKFSEKSMKLYEELIQAEVKL